VGLKGGGERRGSGWSGVGSTASKFIKKSRPPSCATLFLPCLEKVTRKDPVI